jgi:membrane protease subunit HflK
MKHLGYLAVGLLVLWSLSGIREIQPGERAVVRRFGRVLPHQPEPGLWIGLPWGIDRIDRVRVNLLRHVMVGYQPETATDDLAPTGQLLTGDHNLINLQVAVVYSVHDDKIVDFVLQNDRADALVARAVESLLAEWVASRTIDEVLLRGKAEIPRWLNETLPNRLEPYRLGIQVRDDASVTYLFPPDEVKPNFDEVTRAQASMRTLRNQAEQEAERRLRAAQSDRYRILQRAAASAREQKLLAHADARKFLLRLEQYHALHTKNPDFLTGIWWDEMRGLFAKLREAGKMDLLDHHLGADGLDVTIFPPSPKKR